MIAKRVGMKKTSPAGVARDRNVRDRVPQSVERQRENVSRVKEHPQHG
jgi:hypothetical protein